MNFKPENSNTNPIPTDIEKIKKEIYKEFEERELRKNYEQTCAENKAIKTKLSELEKAFDAHEKLKEEHEKLKEAHEHKKSTLGAIGNVAASALQVYLQKNKKKVSGVLGGVLGVEEEVIENYLDDNEENQKTLDHTNPEIVEIINLLNQLNPQQVSTIKALIFKNLQ